MADTPEDRQNQRVATKIRGVRVDDELWDAAKTKATSRRETVADVIRRALLAYIEDGSCTCEPVAPVPGRHFGGLKVDPTCPQHGYAI